MERGQPRCLTATAPPALTTSSPPQRRRRHKKQRNVTTHRSQWNDEGCHLAWARKAFHVGRPQQNQTADQQQQGKQQHQQEPRGAVVGIHHYASSWTWTQSASAQRMRRAVREVPLAGLLGAAAAATVACR